MNQTIKGIGSRALLIILDGLGIDPNSPKNAVAAAKKPNLDKLFHNFPYTEITAGGEEVGLPKGVCGNSEVGHLNLGAGRAVRQDLVRINEAIQNNTLKDMPLFKELVKKTKEGSGRLHLMGLLSDGGVHSHIDHIIHIIEALREESDLSVFFHAFMDGRDTPKNSGISHLEKLQKTDGFTFASMQGRSLGMDRDRRWEKIELAYKTLIGEGDVCQDSPKNYLEGEYKKNIFDEFITPTLFHKDYAIKNDDVVFFTNFRPDRAKQISKALAQKEFSHFKTELSLKYYLCMTPYFEPEEMSLPILFDKEPIKGGLAEYLSGLGKKQFKLAETEKYAHVTYFFNGGEEKPFDGEERALVPSPREVATYDEKPQMSAFEVCDKLIEKLSDKSFTFYLVNFANSDMVGHTGNYEAAIKAIEALDECVGRLMEHCQKEGVPFLLTADHGNSDQMVYPDGTPHTAHTNAPVPFVLFSKEFEGNKEMVNEGKFALKDVAPTLLHLLDIEKPPGFQGQSIFK
jgi:2,3-bisphosphoglycerate-independent phosphoglycerate mutase